MWKDALGGLLGQKLRPQSLGWGPKGQVTEGELVGGKQGNVRSSDGRPERLEMLENLGRK